MVHGSSAPSSVKEDRCRRSRFPCTFAVPKFGGRNWTIYLTCMGVAWWCYMRTRFLVSRIPSLAKADA
ncbi:hypothetical protein WME79_21000 [Sorangium sp. So ce726]|uniref:hypothetical protein n=1 Tax=Sorangium sp. So ce726 TaxID=3133319 RepID=UPI003F5EA1E9